MIDVSKITERQKLTISKGLCDYCYIMNNWKKNDKDFQDVYYDFYLKARWSKMNKPENKDPYFNRLQRTQKNDNLIDIIEDLKKGMDAHSYEFSIASKLLHTINPENPIYDRKVHEYLTEQGVDFCWKKQSKNKRQNIENDWNKLKTWYNDFLKLEEGKDWIKWFDTNFPNYKNISDVKKIDFIIFATR